METISSGIEKSDISVRDDDDVAQVDCLTLGMFRSSYVLFTIMNALRSEADLG